MSSGIDWGDLQPEEDTKAKSIDWGDLKAQDEPEGKLDMFGRRSTPRNISESKMVLPRQAKVIGSTIAGIPGDIASSAGSFVNWLAKNIPGGKPLDEESMKEITENPFTSQKIQSGLEKLFPSLAAESEGEKSSEENLSLLTSLLAPFPGSKAGKAVNPKLETATMKAAQRLGMTEKALTPLTHGEMKSSLLTKLAKKDKGALEALRGTREAIGDIYTDLNARGHRVPLNAQAESDLVDGLTKMRIQLGRTISPSAEKSSAIKFIDDAIDKITTHGATLEEAMNFTHDVNRTVNWDKIQGGKKYLQRANQLTKEAIKQTDPAISADFDVANKLWGKSANVFKMLKPGKLDSWVDYGATAGVVGALVTGNIGLAKKIALTVGGKKALQKISAKMLTDPKWQNILRKSTNSINQNKTGSAVKLLQIIKNKTKEELPEEYNQIDWESLED